jgi:catechol 2,3-dioxygenase
MDKIVWEYPGALFLSAGGYHHHVGTNIWAQGAPPASDNDARILDWELRLPDAAAVDEAAGSIEGRGHSVSREDGGVFASDPWGIRVRLTSPQAKTNRA